MVFEILNFLQGLSIKIWYWLWKVGYWNLRSWIFSSPGQNVLKYSLQKQRAYQKVNWHRLLQVQQCNTSIICFMTGPHTSHYTSLLTSNNSASNYARKIYVFLTGCSREEQQNWANKRKTEPKLSHMHINAGAIHAWSRSYHDSN